MPDEELRPFIDRAYLEIHQFAMFMPEEKSFPLRHMVQHDWLGSYGDFEGLELTLNRMSRRVFLRTDRAIELAKGVDALKEHYAQLEDQFDPLWQTLNAIKRPK
jgi:acyl carrier protein phosphodiesterase